MTRVERSGGEQVHLVRLTVAAEVLDRSPLPRVDDSVWLDGGRVLVIGNDEGVVAVGPSTGTTRLVVEPA